jgi:GTP cyclohydrolase I
MGENIKYDEERVKNFLMQYNLEGPNFTDTPQRVAKAWKEFFNVPKPDMTTFPSCNNEMVVMKGFTIWGYCPHHLLPIRYTFKIGYVPKQTVLGLSKMARLASYIVSKVPLQEDLPCMITEELEKALQPQGAGCLVDGYHLCMAMRGVKQENASFRTTSLTGIILMNPATHEEFVNT